MNCSLHLKMGRMRKDWTNCELLRYLERTPLGLGKNVLTWQVAFYDRYSLVKMIDNGKAEAVFCLEVSCHWRGPTPQVPQQGNHILKKIQTQFWVENKCVGRRQWRVN